MSNLAKNLLYLTASQVATWAITMLVFVVAPSRLGPSDLGKFGFATSYLGFFTLLASLGITPYLLREIARDRSRFGPLVANAVGLKVVSAVALSVVAVAVAPLLGGSGVTWWVVAVGCVGMVFTVVNDVFVGAEAGRERMGRTAAWSTLQVYAGSVVAMGLVVVGAGVVPFAAAFALAAAIPLIANGRAVAPKVAGHGHHDGAIWRELVVGGLPLMALHGLFRIYGTIDVPILAAMAGDTTVGWYTLAYRLATVPIFVATTSVRAFAPSFAAHGAEPGPEFAGHVNRALRLVAAVAVPAAAGIALVAGDVVALLYDERYADSVVLVQILAIHVPFVALGLVLGTALVASDRQRRYLVVAGLGALVSPLGYVAGIAWARDRYANAAIGAATATVVLELVVFAGALIIRAPGVLDRRTVWSFARVLGASGLMGAAVLAVDGNLLVEVLVGAVTYGVATMLVGLVRPRDVVRAGSTLAALRRPARAGAEVPA